MQKIGHASTIGITCSDLALDVSKLVAWKSGIVDRLTGGIETLLKKHGVEVVMGEARLVDATSVCVKGQSGEQTIKADDIVIATGSIPTTIPGFEFDEDAVWSSTDALVPESIPGHLVVIGAGYIGLELGIMYQNLGSQVTVLEATGGVLPGQERDCTKVIERSLKKRKIKLLTETFAKGWERTATGLSVAIEGKTGASIVECDQILSTVGRRPYSEGLGLEAAGLSVNEQGFLDTDRQMRTAVTNIYEIGRAHL